ncbi:uncharacterized protein METZ01_LOCUS507878, partial [marine metagenome]
VSGRRGCTLFNTNGQDLSPELWVTTDSHALERVGERSMPLLTIS